MVQNTIPKFPIGRKAGVVLVVNMIPRDFVGALISAFMFAPGFIVPVRGAGYGVCTRRLLPTCRYILYFPALFAWFS